MFTRAVDRTHGSKPAKLLAENLSNPPMLSKGSDLEQRRVRPELSGPDPLPSKAAKLPEVLTQDRGATQCPTTVP